MTCDYTPSGNCDASLTGPSLAQICGASTFVVFMSLLDELIRSNEKISGKCDRIEPIEEPDGAYDFVVIGGGGAGAPAAGRLSENPDWKVLVIEAGPDEPAGSQIPLFAYSLRGTVLDWNYTVTNESYACLAANGTCRLPSAKMLGGSTSLNALTYLRGNPKDYDNWAAQGNEGWTWNEVVKFYLLSEDNGEIERVGRVHHATGGPLPIQRFPYIPDFGNDIIAASREAGGYGVSEDLNGEQITGFAVVQTPNKDGVRYSSASAYLRPARNRENLHISLNSHATRVIVEDEKAVGVEYFKNGELKTVRVSREIIVSAGTVASSQILLLSGIGPREHLESVGVEVVKDLPGVGENLHNHVGFELTFTINDTDTYDNDWAIATEYLVNRTGPLSCSGLTQVVGILMSEKASLSFPDLQVNFIGYAAACAPGEIGAVRGTGHRTVTLQPTVLHPRSRGRISLASNNPFENPNIWFNYLSDRHDVDVLVEAIELSLGLTDTEAMRARNFTLANNPLEACSNFTFPSTDYWACAVRQTVSVLHHQAGSCKMGPASDPMAVVDPRLRVHGIRGLRVADASVMPQVTSGNTAAPSMMIGERVADFIKKDWAR